MFSNLSEFKSHLPRTIKMEVLRLSEILNSASRAQESKLVREALGCVDHTWRQTAVEHDQPAPTHIVDEQSI